MTLSGVWGGLMLAVTVWYVFDTVRESWRGVATFKTRSGQIIFEYAKADEPALFWLLIIVKLVLLTVIAFIATNLMVSLI